jgi:hypothetical protein
LDQTVGRGERTMTRDEAVELLSGTFSSECMKHGNGYLISDGKQTASLWVNRFVALGMLKLDEPKSIDGRIEYFLGTYTGPRFLQFLNANGLKIVEKQ